MYDMYIDEEPLYLISEPTFYFIYMEDKIKKSNTKICNKCGLIKNINYFNINKKSKDGRRGDCKACYNYLYKY